MIPTTLFTDQNADILAFLDDKQSHSDLSGALQEGVAHLGDVQLYVTRTSYGALVAASQGVIFSASWGMQTIGFRLDAERHRIAREVGHPAVPEIGPGWCAVAPFRASHPDPDLPFWATRAYLHARGEGSG